MNNSPTFSYRETRKHRILTAMRLAAPRCQANNVFLNKSSLTGNKNRQIFASVGNVLVEKKPLPRPAQQFIP